jgi:hypothetical protein
VIRSRLGALAVGFVGTTACLLCTSSPALALNIELITVQAAERGPSDPELASLRPRLRRLVSYRAFRVVRDERRLCAWRNPESFVLPGGRSLQLLPKGMDDQAVTMQVRLLEGRRRLMDTQIRLRNRGTMIFGMGRDGGGSDGALIILLRAEE